MRVKVKSSKITDYYPELKQSNLVKTILHNLDLDEKQAKEFLDSSSSELEDCGKIYGIDKAVKVIEKAIAEKQKIVIHGDFDVDGVCATTILWDYLYFVRKADAFPIIPNRVDEGYGLSEKTIQKAIDMGAKLIITVDCGIKDAAIVEKYKNQIDFVITDHHQFAQDEKGKPIVPKAKAVVHSIHPKSKYSCMISGAATAYQLVRSIESLSFVIPDEHRTKSGGRSGIQNQPELDSRLRGNDKSKISDNYLDLVAISTICDIIPLTAENRKLVLRGIEKVKLNERIGLKELMKLAAIDPAKVESYHFGFVLGPRLNAPGRILNDAMDSMRLLSTRSATQASELALKLNELNLKRQSWTQEFLEKAEKQVNPEKKAIVIMGENWPEGILGLIAGRLSEKYFRPSLVASIGEENKITGSSRSPLQNFYLNLALDHAKDHLIRFGGHKMAAGFASEVNLFDGFEDKIIEYINLHTKEEDFERELSIDVEIVDFSAILMKDIEELKVLEPFGFGNPKPLFLFKKCKVTGINEFGQKFNHIKVNLNHNGSSLIAKGFNQAEKYKDLKIGQEVDLIGHLGINEWNGSKSVEVDIKEIILGL